MLNRYAKIGDDLKIRLYINLPSRIRERFKNKTLSELLLPSYQNAYGSERGNFIKERLYFLVEIGVLSEMWVSRALKEHFDKVSDRSSLLQKLIPLSIVADRYRIFFK